VTADGHRRDGWAAQIPEEPYKHIKPMKSLLLFSMVTVLSLVATSCETVDYDDADDDDDSPPRTTTTTTTIQERRMVPSTTIEETRVVR
jgi:hypothetical protein